MTIVTQARQCLFGEIIDEEIRLAICSYIDHNPVKWALDGENPFSQH